MDNLIITTRAAFGKALAGKIAYEKAKCLHNILLEYQREDAILLLDKKLRAYERYIKMLEPFTGRSVVYLIDPYTDKSDGTIKADIRFVIFIVYLAEAFDGGLKAILTKILKGLIRIIKNDNNTESEDAIFTQILKNLGLKA
jgi:hypothetical protein